MTKKICDCIGCQEEATMTARMPRSIVRIAIAHNDVEVARFTTGVKLVDTDLCAYHAMILSEFFNEVVE